MPIGPRSMLMLMLPWCDAFACQPRHQAAARPFCAALHHDPELEVMPKTRECDSGLLRRDLRAGEVLLKPATRR